MSSRQTNVEETYEDEENDELFVDLIKKNPRPALIWFAGVAILVLLEIGRAFAGLGSTDRDRLVSCRWPRGVRDTSAETSPAWRAVSSAASQRR